MRGIGPVGQQRVADRVDQVRLAETDAAVDEERVVHLRPARRRRAARRCAPSGWRGRAPACRSSTPGSAGCATAAAMPRCRGRRRPLAGARLDGRPLRRRSGGRLPDRRAVSVGRATRCAVPLTAMARRTSPSRAARVTSSRTGLPASSLSTALDAPGVLVADPVELEAVRHAQRDHCAAVGRCRSRRPRGSGRIQVLNCCSGSSAARRSQPRCQRSELIVEKFFGAPHCRPSAAARARVIHSCRPRQSRGTTPVRAGHSLTVRRLFGLIVGFPKALQRSGRPSSGFGHAHPGRRRPVESTSGEHHETHLPSFQSPPCPHAWVSRSHEDPWGPRGDQCTACQGPQATGRLNRAGRRAASEAGRPGD